MTPKASERSQPAWVSDLLPTFLPSSLEGSYNVTEKPPTTAQRTGKGGSPYKIFNLTIQDATGETIIVSLFQSQMNEVLKLVREGKRFGFQTAERSDGIMQTIVVEA